MERGYFLEEEYRDSRKRFTLWLSLFLSSILLLGLTVLFVFLFQTRETKFFFILFGSILSVIFLFFAFFIGFVLLRPYAGLMKLFKDLKVRPKKEGAMTFLYAEKEVATYYSNAFYQAFFEANGKKAHVYLLEEQLPLFEEGKTYALTRCLDVVLSAEETR